MTFSWLGRRGVGGLSSSDNLRGSLISSVMANLQDLIMYPPESKINT